MRRSNWAARSSGPEAKRCFMTWFKICGITSVEDAHAAVEAGANALGFVFYAKSPRCMTPDTAKSIIAQLPEHVGKIGVFVNETVNAISEFVARAGLTAVQLHGDENTEFSRALFQKLANGTYRPTIFRAWPAKVFDVP